MAPWSWNGPVILGASATTLPLALDAPHLILQCGCHCGLQGTSGNPRARWTASLLSRCDASDRGKWATGSNKGAGTAQGAVEWRVCSTAVRHIQGKTVKVQCVVCVCVLLRTSKLGTCGYVAPWGMAWPCVVVP